MAATLVFASLTSFVAFVFLIWVGWVVAQRPASSRRAKTAASAFAIWWYALAASSGVSGVTDLLAATGDPPLTLVVGLQFLNIASLCIGLAGLLYYLVYFYSGRSGTFWPLIVGYAFFAGYLIRALASWGPSDVVATTWQASIVYARSASDTTILVLLGVLIGPQLLASLALFVLATRLPQSASRVRLLVVASAIFGWFGSALLATLVGISENPAWQVVQMGVPVLVGLSVFLVHRPPPWLARRMPPELPVDRHPTTLTRSY